MNARILEIAKKAGLHVTAEGEILPAFFGSVDTGYKRFATFLINDIINEIHVANVGNLVGQSYYLDKVAEHLETQFMSDIV